MGLEITVGALADLLDNDPEGANWLVKDLNAVSDVMKKSGIPPHIEPENAPTWSASGFGYSGLHHLREVAGLIWVGKDIPRGPLDEGSPAETALFNAALPRLEPPKIHHRFFGGKSKPKLPFVHLIVHSDAAGYYVPTDFETPLVPKKMHETTAHIWPLGSVQQLAKEIEILIERMQIPAEMNSEDERLQSLLEKTKSKANSGALWEYQPIAAYTALILQEACAASLKTGAAICFN